jgi:hypothetical protein
VRHNLGKGQQIGNDPFCVSEGWTYCEIEAYTGALVCVCSRAALVPLSGVSGFNGTVSDGATEGERGSAEVKGKSK